jgi:hypothetical protein
MDGNLRTKQKIQNFDGLGLKIAVLYFLALPLTSLKKIEALWVTLKNVKRC